MACTLPHINMPKNRARQRGAFRARCSQRQRFCCTGTRRAEGQQTASQESELMEMYRVTGDPFTATL